MHNAMCRAKSCVCDSVRVGPLGTLVSNLVPRKLAAPTRTRILVRRLYGPCDSSATMVRPDTTVTGVACVITAVGCLLATYSLVYSDAGFVPARCVADDVAIDSHVTCTADDADEPWLFGELGALLLETAARAGSRNGSGDGAADVGAGDGSGNGVGAACWHRAHAVVSVTLEPVDDDATIEAVDSAVGLVGGVTDRSREGRFFVFNVALPDDPVGCSADAGQTGCRETLEPVIGESLRCAVDTAEGVASEQQRVIPIDDDHEPIGWLAAALLLFVGFVSSPACCLYGLYLMYVGLTGWDPLSKQVAGWRCDTQEEYYNGRESNAANGKRRDAAAAAEANMLHHL